MYIARKTTRQRKTYKHDEHDLQVACVKWFHLQHRKLSGCLFAVPNGGRRDATTAAMLKAEGVVAGVSDLLLLVRNKDHGCLCIEMKTSSGNQSAGQREWQNIMENVGNKYVICRSVDDFIREVNDYLSNI